MQWPHNFFLVDVHANIKKERNIFDGDVGVVCQEDWKTQSSKKKYEMRRKGSEAKKGRSLTRIRLGPSIQWDRTRWWKHTHSKTLPRPTISRSLLQYKAVSLFPPSSSLFRSPPFSALMIETETFNWEKLQNNKGKTHRHRNYIEYIQNTY